MIETSSGLPRVFGHFRKIFGNVRVAYGQVLKTLRKVVGNHDLRQIVKKRRHQYVCIKKKNVTVRVGSKI